MTENLVLIQRENGIAEVTINRPAALNALNGELIDEITFVFSELAHDDKARVIILTGAGEKAFVAGADIKEMVEMKPIEARAFAERGQRLVRTIRTVGRPTIAAVNGFALGGGLEIALACSFIYASENARLGLPEVSLGVLPSFGGTQTLPRVIGEARAREMIATGRKLTAREAFEWGIVNRVLPASELLPAARATAQEILTQGDLAVGHALESVNQALSLDLEEGLRLERTLFGLLFSTSDQRDRMVRFIQKK